MNRKSPHRPARRVAVGEKRRGSTWLEGARGFTLIELLVVIAIISLLAGLAVGLTRRAKRASTESRIRAGLNELVTGIDAFQAEFNQYPPDHPGNPVTNALFYELSGTVIEKDTFYTPNRSERIDAAVVQQFFGVEGFVNAKPNPRDVKSFINFRASQYKEIRSGTPDVEVLVVPVSWPLNRSDQPTPVRGLNPWRYVSTRPTNNVTSYDLWAEYVDGNRVRVISNWAKDPFDRP
jgi:prepilin-type N-terminal cleavage/methylation domain-containing protein